MGTFNEGVQHGVGNALSRHTTLYYEVFQSKLIQGKYELI